MVTLNLHGMTVEEATKVVRHEVHQCHLRGYPDITIVHGKGTGRLRKAMRQLLRSIPYVKKIRRGKPEEGGNGVTIAILG